MQREMNDAVHGTAAISQTVGAEYVNYSSTYPQSDVRGKRLPTTFCMCERSVTALNRAAEEYPYVST